MRFFTFRSGRRGIFAVLAVTIVTGLSLAGCGSSGEEPASTAAESQSVENALLTANGLDGLDARQIIDHLDRLPVSERPGDLFASVEPDELILSDGGAQEVRLPMPENEMYISVAPFRAETHECHFHSLTTCLGELGNTEVKVKLTGDDGKVIVDDLRDTFDNGFVGFWVPRGIRGNLTIEANGKTASETISTGKPDDRTCITTMKLT